MSLSIERTLGPVTYPQSPVAPHGARFQSDVVALPTRSPMVCAEVAVLFMLCMADGLSSAWLFHMGFATEANPVLRGAAEAGTVPFLLAKSVSFVPALIASEWWRRQRPTLVPKILRGVIAAYIAIFTTSVAGQFIG